MRVVFAGTPDIAVPALRALAARHEVVGVLTSPDAAVGRKLQTTAPAVKTAALELGLPVVQPAKLDAEARETVGAWGAEILVCYAYGFIFGPKFLALFPRGGVNVHPSLLPRHRGPSPLSAAILAGDTETGISVQRLALEMDSGDLLVQERRALDGSETTASLTAWAAEEGARLLIESLDGYESGRITPWPQAADGVSYCRLIRKEDARIDWNQPAVEITRQVRAFDPWPRSQTLWNGQPLQVHEAAVADGEAVPGAAAPAGSVLRVDTARGILVQTGQGLLALRRLQLPGKKALDATAFLNGARGFVGSVLGV